MRARARTVEVDVTGSPELPSRPAPRRPIGELTASWVRWFGVGRLVMSALSVVAVIVGATWLLRAPAPATEARLPIASPAPTSSIPGATALSSGAMPALSSLPIVPPTSIVVHVAGAVVVPGVHVVDGGARVSDAVIAAGGVTPDGQPDAVNLAAPLADGQRIYVPRQGEVDPASLTSSAGAEPSAPGASSPARPIDVNVASAAELERLPGVGPATAAAIVDDRARNGPFVTVDDLDRVPGIGAAKLERLRSQVTV